MDEASIGLVDLPNLDPEQLQRIDREALAGPTDPDPPPRILILYGSLRERSFLRYASEEAGRLLRCFGAETRTFSPLSGPALIWAAPHLLLYRRLQYR